MLDNKMVSICLLTFNRADKIGSTIESILAQSYANFEFIICDDCSLDNTSEICSYYADIDSRIIYKRNDINLGMPGNLNAAIKLAKYEYVANLHDGDIYHPDLILKWVDALNSFPTVGFVFNAYETISQNGNKIIYKEPYPNFIKGEILAKRLLSRWDSCVFGTVMCRKKIYESLNYFDYDFQNFSDVDMWIRISKNFDVAYVNEPLMHLMEKDKSRFYGFVHWQVIFWILMIHKNGLENFKELLPDFVSNLVKKFKRRRRNLLIIQMLICIKHRRCDRIKEGLAIWKDSDDLILKFFGIIFGRNRYKPNWYSRVYWVNLKF